MLEKDIKSLFNDQCLSQSDGTGTSSAEVQEGHEGQSSKVAPSTSSQSQKVIEVKIISLTLKIR